MVYKLVSGGRQAGGRAGLNQYTKFQKLIFTLLIFSNKIIIYYFNRKVIIFKRDLFFIEALKIISR